jgi:uncharacterized membrane protein
MHFGIPFVLASSLCACVSMAQQFVPIPGTSTVPGENENVCIVSGVSGYSGVRVSSDGQVVGTVGFEPGFVSGYIPRYGVRWTAASGTQIVTPPLGGLYPVVGLSADGSTLLGEYWRWTVSGGYQNLLPLLSDQFGVWRRELFGCSDDGLTLVGIEGIYPDEGDMFTLRLPSPSVTRLPRASEVPQGYFYFNSISGDGRVVGGSTRAFDPSNIANTLYAGVVIRNGAPQLVTNQVGQAGVTDLSFDGSVAVGYTADGGFRLRAFRWDGQLQFLDEGLLGGSDSAFARAVNADGSVAVGEYLRFGTNGTRAWLWREGEGIVDLQEYLADTVGLSLELNGWLLSVASDVSADGLTIVGQGRNPTGCEQAFLVRLPGPEGCRADFNGDGGVDSDDVIDFFAQWDSGALRADFNRDGGVDADDVIAFFGRWDEGC